MAKDLNTDQLVAGQDLKDADAVNQQDLQNDLVNQAQSDGTLADGTSADKTVKYSEFQKANEAKKLAEEARIAAEEQTAQAQRSLELLQMQKLAEANPVQPKTSMEQALLDCGITAEDMFGAEIPRVMACKDEIDRANTAQQQAVAGVQQFVINHSDINEVVGSVNPATGQIMSPNAEVMALVAKKPYLRQATTEAIYDAVLVSRKLEEFEKIEAVNKEHLNRQNIDNVTDPLGGSAAGGGAAGDVQHQAWLSRDEQNELRRKVEAGETV
ncbi:hypothetical protein LCGC14_0756660 [marine sediment metagenome]|uniref:Uncharacterized protein n=1 Tax=marine sediment metagenome TaxID=412755 RepID=A0A0F9Q2F1_9ZZZZ|nr:hypothetical protein [Pricia sp.]